jgi:hypothetical protein
MWVWLRDFIQCIHLCLILKWSWVILFNLFKHINSGVFIHLPMFHWFIVIWRWKLMHKPRLYTSYNILALDSHQLYIWDFVQLIKYYKSPYFVLISITLNHSLWLRIILHSFIRMNNQLHLSPWKSLSKTVPSLKISNLYVPPYHFLW